MTYKYHIETRPAQPRYERIGKYGIIDFYEDCSQCHTCVKDECIYLLYGEEAKRLKKVEDFADYLYDCKGCLECIQNCTKGLLSRAVNPEFVRLGNEYWTPDILLATWYMAETGRIPVSGAGYGGPFIGEGFDSMWTDMSEIVRPTRDGIHGREYISTNVDIGGKYPYLQFEGKDLITEPMSFITSPLPVIINIPQWHRLSSNLIEVLLRASEMTSLFVVVPHNILDGEMLDITNRIIPDIEKTDADLGSEVIGNIPAIQISFSEDVINFIGEIKGINPDIIPIVKLPFSDTAYEKIKELHSEGIYGFHLYADWKGNDIGSGERKIKDLILNVHSNLMTGDEKIRSNITLIGSGGIAMAEHMAKAILCGLDVVGIDIPLMVALECRLCERCHEDQRCPISLVDVDIEYGTQRIVNLLGAWHNQLLEIMGAMGIREVRRMVGETGRVIFYEDLKETVFDPIFKGD
jgi:hypothetical protein